jgi:TolC family type I secretion outer membrane protein
MGEVEMVFSARHGILMGSLSAALLLGTMVAVPAMAQTLDQSWTQSYQTNPQLLSGRARLRATDERLPQAQAGWRPTVSTSASVGRLHTEQVSTRTNKQNLTPKSYGISVTQPLYRGGIATEQQIFLDTATFYVNVIRDQAVVELNANNELVLQQQLQAAQDRFRVGEVTRTDVSQAEARLASVIADKQAAEGQLRSSKASFTRSTGLEPTNLSTPIVPLQLIPTSLEEARTLAQANNPAITAAQYDEGVAKLAVDEVRGELLPTVSLVGDVSRRHDQQIGVERTSSASVTVQVSAPLYEGGSTYSRVRSAKQTAGQRKTDIDTQRRSAVEQATQAYEQMKSAQARIESLAAQIRANEIALEGVRQEAVVGSRTTLDVLNAEQELLNARVSMVRSKRDEQVAAYSLLSATGRLTARQLGLAVPLYDVEENYRAVDGKWLGTGIAQE